MGILSGLIRTVISAFAVVLLGGALIFGAIYGIAGNTKDSAAISFHIADIGGTGAGVTIGGVPIAADGFKTGLKAIKRIRCDKNPNLEVCKKA